MSTDGAELQRVPGGWCGLRGARRRQASGHDHVRCRHLAADGGDGARGRSTSRAASPRSCSSSAGRRSPSSSRASAPSRSSRARCFETAGVNRFADVAYDTVAAIVNDLCCVGALPLVVNAYFATGSSEWYAQPERVGGAARGLAPRLHGRGVHVGRWRVAVVAGAAGRAATSSSPEPPSGRSRRDGEAILGAGSRAGR